MLHSLGNKTLIGFIGIIALLLITAGISAYNIQRLKQNSSSLARTYETLDVLTNIFSSLKDAQLGERGFVITGDTVFLQPYEDVLAHVQGQFRQLHKLLDDTPHHQSRLPLLEEKITRWLAFSKEVIKLRQENKYESAQHLFLTGQGERLMDEIRELVVKLERTARITLRLRDRQAQHSYHIAIMNVLATTLLGLVMVGIAWQLWRQEITHQQQMEQALQDAYAVLEQQVKERTLELTLANAELQELTMLQRAIFDSANYSIISTDLNGTIQSFNRAAERWLLYRAEEVVGLKNIALLHDPEDIRDHAEALSKTLQTPIPKDFTALCLKTVSHGVEESEWRYLRKDGGRFPVLLSVTALRDGENKIQGLLAIASDLTERKQIEEKLQQEQASLAHAQRLIAIGEIMATLAHEINQPLAAITHYVEGARVRFRNEIETLPALGKMLDQIHKLAAQMAQVIRSIRELTRKHDLLDRQNVDLNVLIQETLPLIGTEVARRGIKIQLLLASKLPEVVGHRISLQQLLLNLLLNAMDALLQVDGRHRQLTIRTDNEPQRGIILQVNDTGPGFSEDMRNKLFEPFVSTKNEGMGLGLAICRTIAEAHGGTISASTLPGSGASFTVVLPMSQDTHEYAI